MAAVLLGPIARPFCPWYGSVVLPQSSRTSSPTWSSESAPPRRGPSPSHHGGMLPAFGWTVAYEPEQILCLFRPGTIKKRTGDTRVRLVFNARGHLCYCHRLHRFVTTNSHRPSPLGSYSLRIMHVQPCGRPPRHSWSFITRTTSLRAGPLGVLPLIPSAPYLLRVPLRAVCGFQRLLVVLRLDFGASSRASPTSSAILAAPTAPRAYSSW